MLQDCLQSGVIAMMTIASLGLGRGRTGLGDGVGNSWLTAEVFIRALANLPLRRQSAFRVTPKAASPSLRMAQACYLLFLYATARIRTGDVTATT